MREPSEPELEFLDDEDDLSASLDELTRLADELIENLAEPGALAGGAPLAEAAPPAANATVVPDSESLLETLAQLEALAELDLPPERPYEKILHGEQGRDIDDQLRSVLELESSAAEAASAAPVAPEPEELFAPAPVEELAFVDPVVEPEETIAAPPLVEAPPAQPEAPVPAAAYGEPPPEPTPSSLRWIIPALAATVTLASLAWWMLGDKPQQIAPAPPAPTVAAAQPSPLPPAAEPPPPPPEPAANPPAPIKLSEPEPPPAPIKAAPPPQTTKTRPAAKAPVKVQPPAPAPVPEKLPQDSVAVPDTLPEAAAAAEAQDPGPVVDPLPELAPPTVAPEAVAETTLEAAPYPTEPPLVVPVNRVEPRAVTPIKVFYPPRAKALGEQGSVVLEVLVDEQGRPARVVVQRSVSPDLDAAAIDAVKRRLYQPATEDGRPVQAWIRETINFVR